MSLPRGAQEWLERWVREDRPTSGQRASLVAWIEDLESAPRQLPSTETSWPFPRATGELRVAYLIDADAFIVYAVEDHQSRLLYIGVDPPDDLQFRMP